MSDGWDTGGSDRLFCEALPGDGDLSPASFLGLVPWPGASGTAPTVAITTGDVSYELWALRKIADSPGGDVQFISGLAINDVGGGNLPLLQCGFRFRADSDSVTAVFSDASNFGSTSGTPTRRGVWNHYCLNADRSGDMTLFIDNVSKGTDDISAATNSLANPELHALVENQGLTLPNFDDSVWTDNNICPVVVGPLAVHNRLLTQDEIQASIDSRYVQDIASVTQVIWDWTKVDGETGWETDSSKLMECFRMALNMPGGQPLGTNGTVTVRDRTSNNVDWTVPTLTEYTTTTATKMRAPFGSEAVYR